MIRSIFFDGGETIVDEARMWTFRAERADLRIESPSELPSALEKVGIA